MPCCGLTPPIKGEIFEIAANFAYLTNGIYFVYDLFRMPKVLPTNILLGQTVKFEKVVWVFSSLFLFTAYLTHLGYIPLDIETDEARRALVSLEMMLSKNYLTPTLNGELFLNKPPLYNWLVIASVKLCGSFSMFAFRLPVIISLACMGTAVYYFTKKYTSSLIAFFTAFAFCTNGRIFIYDSFQGLIDTTFSCIVYLNFMVIFWLGEQKKFALLFLLSYLLTAIGFLTKGMPMLVFQGVSLITYFVLKDNVKRLLQPVHFLGLGVLVLVPGAYYIAYFSINPIPLSTLFSNLLHESTKRTGLELGAEKTFFHFFSFPFGFLFHFAPWTIFSIALVQKNVLKKIKENSFIHYSASIFMANLMVYWLSPEVYPRYLFMFLPLFFSVVFYLYFNHTAGKWQQLVIDKVVFIFCAGLLLASCATPFIKYTDLIMHAGIKAGVLAMLLLATLHFAITHKSGRLYAFIVAIIIARFGFNLFVIEQRGARYFKAEETANTIAVITQGQPLYLLKNAAVGNFDGMTFHISKRRQQLLQFSDSNHWGAFYIADIKQLKDRKYINYLQFNNYLSDTLQLVKFR